MTIRSKLSIAVSLGFVTFSLAISLIALRDFSSAYRANVEHDLRHLNAQYNEALDDRIDQAKQTLTRVAAALPQQSFEDETAAQRFLAERIALRALFPGGLLLVDAAGQQIAAAATPDFLFPDAPEPLASDLTQAQLLIPVTAGTGRNRDRLPAIVATPVVSNGTLRGVLYGALDLHQLAFHVNALPDHHLLGSTRFYVGSSRFEHANDGRRMQRSAASAEEIAACAATRDATTLSYRQIDDEVVISAWSRLSESGLVIETAIPGQVAFAPLVSAERHFALAVVAGTVAMLVLARVLARRMTVPLTRMTATIGAMEETRQLRPLNLNRRDEVGELAHAFDRMVATIERQQRELNEAVGQARDEAARSEAILAALGDGLSIQDRDYRILYQNDSHRQMIGSHLGRRCYEAYHPGRHDVCPNCPVALAMTDGAIHRSENTTDLGEREITVEIIASPLRNAAGEIVAGIELVRNISESKAAERQIRQLNRELQLQAAELAASNDELRAFSSSLSHDLKTPLTAIYTSAQILADEGMTALDENSRYLVTTICSTCERMEGILDGMLLLSHIGQSELCRRRIDLTAMAREIALGLQVMEPQRRVVVDIAEGLAAEGDPRLIRSLLENLLGNAWKYTALKDEGRIDVFAEEQDGRTAFVVRDNGAGFDMAHAGRLFKPFQRLHPTGQFKGNGIGLATVERIVRRHGGSIAAHGAPGAGATFSFTLP